VNLYLVRVKNPASLNPASLATYIVRARHDVAALQEAEAHAFPHTTPLGRHYIEQQGLVTVEFLGEAYLAPDGSVREYETDTILCWQPYGWYGKEKRDPIAEAKDGARSQLAMRDEARERATHDRPGST
jgi:hypothetical protein